MALSQPILCSEGKFIYVYYNIYTESVAKMVLEHYDTSEYDGAIFLINVWCDEWCHPFNKYYFESDRIIYYFLEHTVDFMYYSIYKDFIEWVDYFGFSEIWTMDYNMDKFRSFLGMDIPVRYMPVRYTYNIKRQNVRKKCEFDFGFAGDVSYNIGPHRNNILKELRYSGIAYKIVNGNTISNLQNEFANCKFIADIPRNSVTENDTQNQVRIFEHICLGHHVLSEKAPINIFPGLITEWTDTEDFIYKLKNTEPQEFSEKYKEMTYRDEDYEIYRNNILEQYNEICKKKLN